MSRKVVDEQLVQALAIGHARLAQRQGAVAHIPGGSQGRIQLFADLQRLHLGNLADMFFGQNLLLCHPLPHHKPDRCRKAHRYGEENGQ